jgi:hypothetical protein
MRLEALCMSVTILAGCGGSSSVNSDEQARRAYLGLNESISKSLALGFTGYNAAANANIPTETAPGDASGTITVTGHVDQGNPSQISMGLNAAMAMYSDGDFVIADMGQKIMVTYATDSTALPTLTLKLNASAGDTLSGSLDGTYTMTGELQGKVTLAVQLAGTFTGTAPNVMRVVGSTTVTGIATNSSGGSYSINETL